jgi:hypothetical protein
MQRHGSRGTNRTHITEGRSFSLRISDFELLSDFDIRISDLFAELVYKKYLSFFTAFSNSFRAAFTEAIAETSATGTSHHDS